MYDYEIEYPMQSLYIAKTFYDHDRLDKRMENLDDNITISWDELGWIETVQRGKHFGNIVQPAAR